MESSVSYDLSTNDGCGLLRLSGSWLMRSPNASGDELLATLGRTELRALAVDLNAVEDWDSLLVVSLIRIERLCKASNIDFDRNSLPTDIKQLIELSEVVPPNTLSTPPKPSLINRFLNGDWAQKSIDRLLVSAEFIGEVLIALRRLSTGRANMRRRDLIHFIEQCGPGALRIVTLISVLVGMILGYLGSVQLRQIGAQVYVADLVGLGMVREMGALMTAIIMAGRTGAAYAAQLGTMQTRDEIDAVVTLGISPIEFLVLPRMLALVAVMPLLCLYSDLLGMLGGALVAISMEVSYVQYFTELQSAVTLHHISAGLIKSLVFGVVIALTGCRAGMQSGRSSEAVGAATTQAVVAAVVWLVVADAAINIVYQRLDF